MTVVLGSIVMYFVMPSKTYPFDNHFLVGYHLEVLDAHGQPVPYVNGFFQIQVGKPFSVRGKVFSPVEWENRVAILVKSFVGKNVLSMGSAVDTVPQPSLPASYQEFAHDFRPISRDGLVAIQVFRGKQSISELVLNIVR